MDNTIYANSVARIRFFETRMMGRARLDALVDTRSFDDSLRLLQDSRYNEYLNTSSYEKGLKLAIEDLYKEMYKISPVKEVIDVLAIRYDAHNIKSLIKGRIIGADTSSLLIDAGTIPADALCYMIREENYKGMPGTLKSYIEKAVDTYKSTEDPQEIDMTIDRGMFQYMLEVAGTNKIDYLTGFVKLWIDMLNIKSFIRIMVQGKGMEFLHKTFIPGGRLELDVFTNNLNSSLENFINKIAHTDHYKWVREGIGEYIKSGDLGNIEKHGDNYVLSYMWNAKLIMFGPEPLVAYIIAVENEIKALRIILTGKKNEVGPEIIRERLRDVYV